MDRRRRDNDEEITESHTAARRQGRAPEKPGVPGMKRYRPKHYSNVSACGPWARVAGVEYEKMGTDKFELAVLLENRAKVHPEEHLV